MKNSDFHVLIADDDAEDAQMLVEVLSELIPVFEFERVKNGIECLRTLKSAKKPDVVFIDINMPLKNGIECLHDMRSDALLRETPVIIYSTGYNPRDIEAAYEYGARAYLVKPCSYRKLVELLELALKKVDTPLKYTQPLAGFVISENQLEPNYSN